jgi:hypothetical protein
MNHKFWIQYPLYDHQMLRPLGELLGFRKNKIREEKVKSSYFP